MQELIEHLINHTSNLAISSSTLRNQGAKGIITAARKFLREMKLQEMTEAFNTMHYATFLDKETNKLIAIFSKLYDDKSFRNFGAARKSINIFARDVFYNKIFIEHYKINQGRKHYSQLELPLDSYTTKGILKSHPDLKSHWNGIKYLTPDDNIILQTAATKIADSKKINRIELDIIWWRINENTG